MRMDSIFSYTCLLHYISMSGCNTLFKNSSRNLTAGEAGVLSRKYQSTLTIVTLPPHRLSPRNTNKINASLLSLGQGWTCTWFWDLKAKAQKQVRVSYNAGMPSHSQVSRFEP